MEDYQKKALNNCLIKSWAAFEPTHVTNDLLRNAILDEEDVKKICSGIDRWARVQLLLSSLKNKTGTLNTFEAFLTALKLCQKYNGLVNDLEKTAASLQKYNRKVEELLQSSAPEENLMYLDMILSVADSLNTSDSLKLCKHFVLADEWMDTVKESENPGLTIMNICRRIRIVTFSNIQNLRDALIFLSLDEQRAFVERYVYALTNRELELIITKTEPDFMLDKILETLHDRTMYFKVGRKLRHLFHTTYDRTSLVDFKVDSGVLILKVPTKTAIENLHKDLSSEKLASKLLPLLLTTGKPEGVGATDERNPKISLALNEHAYRILKFHFENLASRNRDDSPENMHDEASNTSNNLIVPCALAPKEILTPQNRNDPPRHQHDLLENQHDESVNTTRNPRVPSTSDAEKLAPPNRNDPLQNPDEGLDQYDETTNNRYYLTVSSALGPEITVTITSSDPDTLLTSLRKTLNDKQNLHTKARTLRTFFHLNFEDISCAKIREGSNGVSFVLRVKTVSALHRLHTTISKGELAKNMLSTVQHTVGDKLTKSARMLVTMDEEDYRNAQTYFETSTSSSRSRDYCRKNSSPIVINQGSSSDPLYVGQEMFEMIEQMSQEYQAFINAHSRPGSI